MAIITEWDAFRALDLGRVTELLRGKVVVDLRNIYRPAEMSQHGLTYVGIGRPDAERAIFEPVGREAVQAAE